MHRHSLDSKNSACKLDLCGLEWVLGYWISRYRMGCYKVVSPGILALSSRSAQYLPSCHTIRQHGVLSKHSFVIFNFPVNRTTASQTIDCDLIWGHVTECGHKKFQNNTMIFNMQPLKTNSESNMQRVRGVSGSIHLCCISGFTACEHTV